ncbi:MAG: hypothetical protein K0Q59_1616 [Paenibacillus sp.]|nr:hypothetical protein [Paenibacillus sp.]
MSIFAYLFLVSLLLFLFGIFSPRLVLFGVKNPTRGRSALIYGISTLTSLVLLITMSIQPPQPVNGEEKSELVAVHEQKPAEAPEQTIPAPQGEPAPAAPEPKQPEQNPAPATTPVPKQPVTTPAPKQQQPFVSYSNCTQVKAAGKAPLRRGDAGYSSKLDRDGDGIACE